MSALLRHGYGKLSLSLSLYVLTDIFQVGLG